MPDAGMMAVNYGTKIGGGLLGAAVNYKYSKKLANLNYKLNEQAAEAADARRRALYGDFESPMATIRQLKEAGLSPSMYASGELGGSIGSTTGAQGAGGAGVTMANMGLEAPDLASMQVQEAQARLMNAEADKLEGRNAEGRANIGALEAQAVAAYAKAGLDNESKELAKTNKKLKDLELEINTEGKDASIHKIKMEAQIAEHQANKLFWDGESAHLAWLFNVETWEKRKQELANTISELASRTALQKSQAALNNEEKKHIIDFVNAALDEAKAHTENARTYGEWVEANKENMKAQIELRGQELNVEKWRIGVDAVVDIVQGTLFAFGYNMFRGQSATETIKENYSPNGASNGYSKTTTRRSHK